MRILKTVSVIVLFLFAFVQMSDAQRKGIVWTKDGLSYMKIVDGEIVKVDVKKESQTVVLSNVQCTPVGSNTPLLIEGFSFNVDNTKILLYTNAEKVWRYKTRGDYWVFDIASNKLNQLGKNLPARSLMFAKFSPDGKQVAYVSEHNIFSEELATSKIKKLTIDGTRKLINGTFDWVYEEEFGCRDGFRWSPDSKSIAFWQIDANKIRDYYMLNTTDSVYSKIIPVEYPKVGEAPSSAKIGVVLLANSVTKWMKIEGDPRQNYLTRMEWSGTNEIIVQQIDRRQQESKLIYCNSTDGNARTFWAENDKAWVDMNTDNPVGWNWINNKQDFLWVSEKDGWRHIYKISKDGKTTTLITKGNFDIGEIKAIDEVNNYVYFTASPENATQLYLYRVKINVTAGKASKEEPMELLSNTNLKGTHNYDISPNAKMALHSFSNHNTPPILEWVELPENTPTNMSKSILKNVKTDASIQVEYIKLLTADNVELDAWINKPKNFNPNKKYPLVIYVYGEPAAKTTDDEYGNHENFLYNGSMSEDGYIQVALDNRGTPSLKGAAWRKAIYRRNGQINIRDMAMGVIKLIETSPFIDTSRVAVWGWSGGGSSTLNLLFQFPSIFKTGISIAPVTNLLFYDNIYTERYMGLPQENMQDFIKGSPMTHAKGLEGNLLLVHGTGDDNVHYSNAESLINELIKYNKQFQFMPYPNRTHSISEGEGTFEHLSTLYTNYLRSHCKPGGE
jgi:dipeptidyl-peptidase-4